MCSFPLFDFSQLFPTVELHFETRRHTDVKKAGLKKAPMSPWAHGSGPGRPWLELRGEAQPAGCSDASPSGRLRRCLETVQQCLPSA